MFFIIGILLWPRSKRGYKVISDTSHYDHNSTGQDFWGDIFPKEAREISGVMVTMFLPMIVIAILLACFISVFVFIKAIMK